MQSTEWAEAAKVVQPEVARDQGEEMAAAASKEAGSANKVSKDIINVFDTQ